MLTIKNKTVGFAARIFPPRRLLPVICCLFLLAGCMPPGPRALLDGKKLIEQGKYAEAAEKLKMATTLLATNAQAWNYLGLASQLSGEAADAERSYKRALQLNPDLTEAHYNLGCLWLSQNKFEAAKGEFTAFTLRRGTIPEGYLKLAEVQLRASEQHGPQARTVELASAEKSFGDALKLAPQNVEAFNGLGLVKFQRGHFSEAAQCFNAALRQQPAYAPALLNLAIVSHQYLRDRATALAKYPRVSRPCPGR